MAVLAAKLAATRPALFRDYVLAYRAGRREHADAPVPPQPASIGLEQFLAQLSAIPPGPAHSRIEQHDRAGSQGSFAALDADISLGEIVYALIRTARPRVVVETGVAAGVTSAYALAALEDNGDGVLHSVDLPPLALRAEGGVGASIPPELRDRWVYHWGDSRRVLPSLLRGLGGDLELFVHDSDHSYASMRWELETAAGLLRSGCWLVADDAAHHTAVADVAAALGAEPLYINQPGKGGLTGLIRKPA